MVHILVVIPVIVPLSCCLISRMCIQWGAPASRRALLILTNSPLQYDALDGVLDPIGIPSYTYPLVYSGLELSAGCALFLFLLLSCLELSSILHCSHWQSGV
jgi:hypothetical protein